LDITLANKGIVNTSVRAVKVYKDSITTANKVASTNWGAPNATTFVPSAQFGISADGGPQGPSTSGFEKLGNGFTDVVISQGTMRTFIINADTTDATTLDLLSFSVAQGQIQWSDGASYVINSVQDLPLAPRTLSY
jgi:hypothetical protein